MASLLLCTAEHCRAMPPGEEVMNTHGVNTMLRELLRTAEASDFEDLPKQEVGGDQMADALNREPE